MKPTNTQSIFSKFRLVALLLSSALLTSCGDGGDTTAGIGGTGITSGEITGFGSVFVNGVQFNTDNSQFVVDGEAFNSQSEAITTGGLAVGMVARIIGNTDDSGTTGSAEKVIYDDEIEGPVAATPVFVSGSGESRRSFSIFGQVIIIDQASTTFEDTNFLDLDANDFVEVSGFRAPDGSIKATFVEKEGELGAGSTKVELKGIIDTFTPSTVTLIGAFSGLTFNIGSSTEINLPSGQESGLFVEIKGNLIDPMIVNTTKIEVKDDSFGDSLDEISLQGIVNNSNGLGTFFIGNQQIDASGAAISPIGSAITNGINVEVEGSIVGGILIAEEIELREGEIELKAKLNSTGPGAGQFSVDFFSGSIVVNTDTQTRFEVDGGPDITLSDLASGDFVVVKGIESAGQVLATRVKRESSDGDSEIKGSVEELIDPSSITILGITHFVDGSTEYETPLVPIGATASDFFGVVKIGDLVEIVDKLDPTLDGIADEVELED